MFEVVAEKGVRPVSKKYGLSQVNELVKECEEGQGGKAVVDMSSK
jgi:D-arabinose 1-dehydrogenase-like Zn-dependent alcohol dehydrogenase